MNPFSWIPSPGHKASNPTANGAPPGTTVNSPLQNAGEFLGLAKPAALGTASGEISENDQRRQQFAGDLANYQNRTAPQQQGVSVGPTAQATMPGYVAPERSQGATGFLAGQAQAGQGPNTRLDQVNPMQAARMDPTSLAHGGAASAGSAQAGQVDTGGAVRDRQMQGLTSLADAAAGTVPSAAESQMKQGMAANIASQYAMARTAHGAGRLSALENAQGNEEQINSNAIGQTAELRANEQSNARNQYAQALSQVRGQDLGAQSTNAQLGTDVSKFNAGNQTDVSKFNTGSDSDIAKFNAGSTNLRNSQQAGFNQDSNTANFNAVNQRNLEQGRISSGEGEFNSGQATDVSKFNAGQSTDVQKYLAGLAQNNQQFNAGQGNDQQKYFAGLNSQVGMYNAGQSNEQGRAQGQLNEQVGANNLNAQTQWGQMDDNQKRAYMDFISQSQQQSINGANGLATEQQAANNARYGQVKDFANLAAKAFTPTPG